MGVQSPALNRQQPLIQSMKAALIFASLAVASVTSLPHKESKSGQLCKGSSYRDVSKCISVHLDDASQFKCAIMYEDLPRANNPAKTRKLTWLGALPDALRKESIMNSEDPELKASFGNIEAKSFWWRLSQYSSPAEFEKERCNAVHASAKWEPVESEGEQLTLSEKLCCKPDSQ